MNKLVYKLIDEVGLARISVAIKELKALKETNTTKWAKTVEEAVDVCRDMFEEDSDLIVDGLCAVRDDPLIEEPEKEEVKRLIDVFDTMR